MALYDVKAGAAQECAVRLGAAVIREKTNHR